jgi:hypothetical protein
MAKNSIFQLRKSEIADKTEVKIRTVNFESEKIEDKNIQDYFNSRIKFLGASYDFAKSAKLNEDFDFADGAVTQAKLESWLNENQQAAMVKGTEFGVITTKVIESISSIQKNPYLKELQAKLKLIIWSKSSLLEPTKSELNNFKLSLNDIQSLTEADIKKVFNYELLEKSEVIINLLEEIKKEEILTALIESLIASLQDFKNQAFEAWNKAYFETQQKLQPQDSLRQISDYAEFYVLKLYFAFDGKIREIEKKLLPGINSDLNSLKQQFTEELLEKYNLNEAQTDEEKGSLKKIKSNLQKIWDFNWTKWDYDKAESESVQNFVSLYDDILNQKEIEDKRFPKFEKVKSELFLAHPKSAPNFPSLKEKVISWDKDRATSNLLADNKQNFNSLKFLDYLLFRIKKVVEGSDVYKVYGHLNLTGDFEWVKWLESFINPEGLKFATDLDLSKISQKSINHPKRESENLKTSVNIVEFVHPNGEINNRLPKIVINLKSKKDRSTDTQIVLNQWLQTHYLDLAKFNVEIALLRDLLKENLLDKNFVESWVGLIKSDDGKKNKLAVRTEKRLEQLQKTKIEPDLQVSKIVDLIATKLTKIENHLLLNKNHNENDNGYKVFDKLSFDKYKKLSQVVYETVLLDKKEIAYQKAELAKLTLDVAQVLPIKVGRMTKRTGASSTLVYDLDKDLNFTNNSSFTLPFIKLIEGLKAGEIKIEDSFEKVLKLYKNGESEYKKIAVGFLNGDNDNNLREIQKKFFSNGNTFEGLGSDSIKLKLFRDKEKDGLFVEDSYLKSEDVVSGNNPGYPKMYFFLIPKVCNNLIIPIQTSKYYLGKYTPYNHLQKYLELEKEAFELEKSGALDQRNSKIIEILALRTYLRSYYTISSLELDLIRDYKLVIDKETKHAAIEPTLKAKVHLQFKNPRKVWKKEEIESWQKKPEHILSVDLGEKHLAVATLSSVDWSKWEAGQFELSSDKTNYVLNPVVKTFLPLNKDDLDDVINLKTSFIDPEKDNFWKKYTSIIERYKAQQKQFGVVQKDLAKAKINLTEKLAEQIASQLVKIAHKHNTIVVFEDLKPGFGRQVETVRLYTAIRRLTAAMLGDVGLLNTKDKTDAKLDMYSRYEFNDGNYSIINPSYTSKTCSDCGYVPVEYREVKTKELKITKGITANYDKWEGEGIISFSNENKIFYTIVAPEKEIDKWQILNFRGEDILGELKNKEIYSNKAFRNLLEVLQSWLYTDKTEAKKELKLEFTKFALKQLVGPRPDQKTFICPCCGHKENADYQASYNIGLHFLIGNKIVEERKLAGVKDLKSGLVEEIRGRL